MRRLACVFFILFPLSVFATDTCPAGYSPAEYVELEYIESTGTQYINTGIIPTLNTKVEVTFMYNSIDGEQLAIIGSADNSLLITHWGSSFSSATRFGDKGIIPSQGAYRYMKDVFYTISIDRNNLVINGTIFAIGASSLSASQSLSIFYDKYSVNNKASTIIQNVKIWDDTKTLIRDFIPVRRIYDGIVGMYDKIKGKFYSNDGTGEFIAGPETGNSFITDENGDVVCVSCPANTYKPNAGNVACTPCPDGTFSPIGSKELSDCAKILRVKDYVVYMPLGKRTEHGLCVMWNGEKYCADVYKRE